MKHAARRRALLGRWSARPNAARQILRGGARRVGGRAVRLRNRVRRAFRRRQRGVGRRPRRTRRLGHLGVLRRVEIGKLLSNEITDFLGSAGRLQPGKRLGARRILLVNAGAGVV